MSSLERFIDELFSPDSTIVLADTGAELDLPTFLALASGVLGDTPATAPPRRSTPEYAAIIAMIARLDELSAVTGALRLLHDDYGWRGPLDVMSEWVAQMEQAPVTHSARLRDFTGAVDLSTIIVIHADDEQTLRLAAEKRSAYEAEGLPPHAAFQRGLADTEAGIALCKRWLPYFQAAFRAAHTARDRRAITAALFKAPGRTDRTELLKGATVLGTAAYAVRHQQEMTARYKEVADGQQVTAEQSITPGWTTNGFVTRSARRHGR